MQLRRELDDVRDNEQLLTIEVEELNKELKRRHDPPPPPPEAIKTGLSQEEQSEEYLVRLQKPRKAWLNKTSRSFCCSIK